MAWDFVIVGAGSAGCVLANRLSADPDCRVLVIEAGGPAPVGLALPPARAMALQGTEHDWAYTTVPQPGLKGRRIAWPRGRALGGTSVLNYLVYVRGSRGDYDHWRELGNPGWGYEDVLPYFRRAEHNADIGGRYHGRGGPLHVEDHPFRSDALCQAYFRAATRLGIPFNPDCNGERQEGCGYLQMTSRRGQRCSTATAYLEPVLHRPNLRVVAAARVLRVLVERGRAVGVRYAGEDGQAVTARADREVIVAAGAVGSPQLLMLSGIGPGPDLRACGLPVLADLPGVGRDLQDHLGGIAVQVRARDARALFPHRFADAGEHARSFAEGRPGPWSSNCLEAGAFLRSDASLEHPDLQLFCVSGVPGDCIGPDAATAGLYFLGGYVGLPASRGGIRLDPADPFGAPRIDPAYLSDPSDLARSIEIIRSNLAIAEAMDEVRGEIVQPLDRSTAGLERFVRERASTTWHPTSTCRMGADPMAVVDAELRVHGVAGLRVCDASVMPTLINGNTNAPTIMIAERCADFVRGDAFAARHRPSTHPRTANAAAG